jgi:DNA-binding transcriptional MerR regulator
VRPGQFVNAAEAARRLGVSPKALRLYEQRGLLVPDRSAAGWRVYGPEHLARAAEIVALRQLGLGLGQVARVLEGDPRDLEPALARHQAVVEGQIRDLSGVVEKLRVLRAKLADGAVPAPGELLGVLEPAAPAIAFDLPWPWGGERFDLRDIGRLTYITGPLGSGKTRLAKAIAAHLPGGVFLGLDRLAADGSAALARLASDPALAARVDAVTVSLVEDSASRSPALLALLVGLDTEAPVVIDMVEQGLDQPTQEALGIYLRQRGRHRGPLFLMTRSSTILDLAASGPTRRSSITARRSASRPIRGRSGTNRSPPASRRPMCGRAPKVSSPGARRRSPEAVGPARAQRMQSRLPHRLVWLSRIV